MNSQFPSFPRQKLSSRKKTKQWYQDCIDSVDSSGYFLDEGVRASFHEKVTNLNLYNGTVDIKDMVDTINPESLDNDLYNAEVQHYPIVNPRIDVLVGEEAKRRFDFTAVTTNPDAISAKEDEKKDEIRKQLVEFLQSEYTEQELDLKLRQLDQNLTSYQDKREIMTNRLLDHFWKELKLDRVFNSGFRDVLVFGEEYYETGIVSGEPYLNKIDPLKVFWIRSGFSNKIEDSDLIIIDDYWAPSKVIDHYHDQLSSKDIDKIESSYSSGGGDPFVDKPLRDMNSQFTFMDSADPKDLNTIDSLISIGQANGYVLGNSYDTSGNPRVLRVFWKGLRKVKKVTYFDDQGDPQEDIFPENYIPKKDEGETAKDIWINEWYEGTKIGTEVFVNLRPKEVQYRKINNPSYCHPGITGKTYSLNSSQTVSLMSKVKNYSYLYDVLHDRLNKLLATNEGKILQMDLASIPEGWDPQKWFYYLKKMKIAVVDSFKEGNKGAATGKLAGGMNNASKGYIDLDQGQNIQQHIALLQFIKQEMTEITGVSDQRLGQISNRETVGGVERSVTQSSHITEWYFSEHDDVKLEALRVLLETAKVAYRGTNKKVQNILNNQDIITLNLDGEVFSENDYGIVLTSSSKTQEAEQRIKQLAEVALNAGTVGFDTVMSIYLTDSIADMRRKIEQGELEKIQREQETQQQQTEAIREKTQQEAADKQADRDLKERNNIRDNQTKLATSLDNGDGDTDLNNDGTDYDLEKLQLDRQKRLDDLLKFNKKLEQEKQQFSEKIELERKKVNKSSSK